MSDQGNEGYLALTEVDLISNLSYSEVKEFNRDMQYLLQKTIIEFTSRKIGHDIVNPLTSISIHLDFLNNLLISGESIDPQISSSLSTMKSNISRIKHLLNQGKAVNNNITMSNYNLKQMLSLSKVESKFASSIFINQNSEMTKPLSKTQIKILYLILNISNLSESIKFKSNETIFYMKIVFHKNFLEDIDKLNIITEEIPENIYLYLIYRLVSKVGVVRKINNKTLEFEM